MSFLEASGLSSGAIALLVGVSFLAGLARGFSGFGGALIFMPLASALVGPRIATVALLLADAVMTAGMLPNGWRNANRRETFVMLAGALVGVPAGAAALAHLPPLSVRWGICILVFAMLVLLVSGWRYRGRPKTPLTVLVGAVAGFFGGAAQLSGPPVVAYWLGRALPASRMRASIVLYFGLGSVLSAASYYANGLFVKEAFAVALIACPSFGLGIAAGARLFGLASEATFRRICLGLIAAAAVLGLPVFG
ncbi:sulfite exporter TauE/SafE family protein [Rhizobiaceae bacterium BDR2-2]|uniref:Probable membrane transporter protein n=1 Tax=Ectorhizobium quercum TaxID=2965071 RepID=A0AAE3N4W7_9HYPH|nr:sulfite exporter TauE/SafE family protein [Ectorhizobium quercum]MCX8996379.1 sulfite exporter TauE/SafE family protein [Ectorhizobium quercum]MCX8998582.1 sulfite exporter TauE/SafE family protein [Ectorhizobium quercum]